jgi:hypothetical protein
VNLGLIGSASATIGDMLSGLSSANVPPKFAQAASHPAITADRVWVKLNHTNRCREYTAVKINAWATRRRPVTGSPIRPRRPKST